MLSIPLQYVAEEFRELLHNDLGDLHPVVMDAYFKLCEKAGIGNKTAVQTLTPSITDEEYYENYEEVI